MNIRSLSKHVSKLEYYLIKMNAPVDLIAISESKITKTANLVFENYINIPNYSFVNYPSLSHFGGVAFSIHNSLKYKVCPELNLGESLLADFIY